MLVLPTSPVKATVENPRYMILYGLPKTGKTTIAAMLENNLIIDTEGGSQFIDALAIQARTVDELGEIATSIRNKNTEVGHFYYKHITIDNATRLEEMCLSYAATLYRMTPQGKSYKGTDIRTLPNGSGYFFIRQAVQNVINLFKDLCDEFILIGHTKDININENGEDITKMSLDLVGKLSGIVLGLSDAVGYVYRKGNETHINFSGGSGIISQARAPHLRGKDIVISESDSDGNITTHWDRVYKKEV